ncbi:MAG TPA: CoA-binding protein [Trueperaceae bacterium]|nr:CoA-binding protein [Trueperaceae bacterium]
MSIIASKEEILNILENNTNIAVLGAHKDVAKAAYFVAEYLQDHNYEVYPVNPVFAGQVILDKEVLSELKELKVKIDIVDIFRRSEHLEEHIEDILAMKTKPKVVWFQSGIKNDKVAKILRDNGIMVIQNKCLLAEHRLLVAKAS